MFCTFLVYCQGVHKLVCAFIGWNWGNLRFSQHAVTVIQYDKDLRYEILTAFGDVSFGMISIWDLRFSQQWRWRLWSYVMWLNVICRQVPMSWTIHGILNMDPTVFFWNAGICVPHYMALHVGRPCLLV